MKAVFALDTLHILLKDWTDKEMALFHQEFLGKFGQNSCVKKCDFKNWQPRAKQVPPLDCELCSSWRDEILKNHTNPDGKVLWKNSEPHLWSQEKWEVAKVYMTEGHKNHKSIGDFDIAALLCLMKHCKHFTKFGLHTSCENVSNVRNKVMHAVHFQLKQEDFNSCFDRIKALGKKLAEESPEFKSLSKDIDEIRNYDLKMDLRDNMPAEGKEILFAAGQLVSKIYHTKDSLVRMEEPDSEQYKEMQTLCRSYINMLREQQKSIAQYERNMEKIKSAAAHQAAEHDRTKKNLKILERRMTHLQEEARTYVEGARECVAAEEFKFNILLGVTICAAAVVAMIIFIKPNKRKA